MDTPPGKEYDIGFAGWDTALQFGLKEACSLMCREVIRNEDVNLLPKPPIVKTGNVLGVIAMNEEIEIIVKFQDEIHQLTKTEFCGDYKLVPEW